MSNELTIQQRAILMHLRVRELEWLVGALAPTLSAALVVAMQGETPEHLAALRDEVRRFNADVWPKMQEIVGGMAS